MDKKSSDFRTEIKRINGYLKEVVTFLDETGEPITHIINPLMLELKPRDVLQLFVGSLLVATPLCFTAEVWDLSKELSHGKIVTIAVLSIFIVISYIYFNFYRFKLRGHIINFVKRIIATYLISLSSVVLMLHLLEKLPLDSWIGINRVIIVGFPSLFGAILSDSLK